MAINAYMFEAEDSQRSYQPLRKKTVPAGTMCPSLKLPSFVVSGEGNSDGQKWL